MEKENIFRGPDNSLQQKRKLNVRLTGELEFFCAGGGTAVREALGC